MARSKRLLLVLLALFLLGGALAAPLIPVPSLKRTVEARLSRMLGRKVSVEKATLHIVGGPYVKLTGMTVEEAPAFGGGVFLQAEQVHANLGVIECLRTRRLSVDAITIKSPEISLIKNPSGEWNWTTLGRENSPGEISRLERVASAAVFTLLGGDLSNESLKRIKIENASVKLVDLSSGQRQETVYNKIDLDARTTATENGMRTQGELTAASGEASKADALNATLPFDFTAQSTPVQMAVQGSVGPGAIDTSNLTVGDFRVDGEIAAKPGAELSGKGRMSASDVFIRTINISEVVARALKIDQIGDMNPGTEVASLETDFELSKGAVITSRLRAQQLDGLGDASAQSGSFSIESALNVHYQTSVTLSSDATSKLRSASPMLGILVAILESNNRLTVPINIDGDVRQPQIQVDVRRIF